MNVFELAVVISAVDKASAVFNGVKNSITGATAAAEKMKNWGQQASVGGALMTGASQKIVSNLEAIVAPANSVEDALAKVETVMTPMSGTMTEALARTQQAAVEWSAAHNDGATKFIDTTYMMISAGLNEKAAVEATRTAMLVAKATMGESTDAANLIGGAYNTMGDKSKDAAVELTRMGDVVTKTQQLFQFANFNQLSEGLKNSTAGALQTGLSFEQLNTVIGTLNSNQLQGAEAGTSFKAAMLNMNKAATALKFDIAKTSDGGLDFIATLANIEKKFGKLSEMAPKTQEAFRTAFGDEGNTAISLLLGKSGELAKSLATVKDSAGAATAAAAIMNDTTSAKTAILENRMIGLKVVLADQLRPTLEAISGYATRAIEATSGWAKAHPDLVRTVGLVAMVVAAVLGVVGPVLLAVGSLGMFGGHIVAGAAMVAKFGTALFGLIPGLISATVSAWGFAAALLANPITWIVLAIVAAAALIYIYWDPIKAFFIALWGGIKSAFSSAWSAIVGVWGRVAGFFGAIWANIKSAFQESFIKGVWTVLSYLSPVGLFIRAFAALWPWLTQLGSALAGWFSALPARILAALSSLASTVASAFAAARDRAIEIFLGFVTWYFSLPGRILAALSTLPSIVASVFSAAKERVFGILSTIASALSGFFLNGIRSDLNAVIGWLSSFSLFDAGMNILRTLTQGIMNAANGPIEAVMGVVQKIRNLLPFSPAKAGPLRDLHRVRLIETIAETVRPAALVTAVSGAAAMAMAVAPVTQQSAAAARMANVPTMAPMPASGARGADGGGGGGEPILVQFNIAGNADATTVAQLERWAKDNAKLLYAVVKRQGDLEKRSEFA